jgi:aspartate racemase
MASPTLDQKLVPGIVGISTYVDFAYHREMQSTARAIAGTSGPINQLKSVTVTLDFRALIANLQAGRIDVAEEQVADAAVALEAAGAQFVVVTSGTTSTLTARARERVAIPFLDIADAVWQEVRQADPAIVGLLSTRHAAAGGIFQRVAERHGAHLVVPTAQMAARLDDIIFDELICGDVTADGVEILRAAIAELASRGAAAVILGNTDMTLAADRLGDAPVPLIDSALAHARAAARRALG